MRITWTALAVATLAATSSIGCKKTNKDDSVPSPNATAGSAAKPADDIKPEPVAKAPAEPPPAAAPAPAAGEVRAPVAADLAEYTKDLSGSGPLTAAIETSMGTFHCELFGDKAPLAVANFVGLATGKKSWRNPKTGAVETGKPLFDGVTFHRVIPGFMIQGGDPTGTGRGDPGYQFANEVGGGLSMNPGTLAMANAGPDTNGCQFFITEGSPKQLDGGYTIFGSCKEPDLVKKIASVARNSEDKPDSPVTIKKITFAKSK
jgi:peptidyl-prolyl cis-trans isomerase A (cyclophilin A)